ncbi:MAG: uroporphyrinogen decarboxylase family protein [Armatimonadota bacterium]
MNQRERFVQSLSFGTPDRVFYQTGNPRKATMQAWYAQGLPPLPEAGDYDYPPELCQVIGNDKLDYLPINVNLFPEYEEVVLEENEHGRIWRDAMGITMFSDNRGEKGFLTRSYIAHPVTDWNSWREMRERFNPDSPERYPADWADRIPELNARDYPIMQVVPGLYWKVRDFVGFEELSVMFYDQPDLVHEMMEHLTDFIIGVLDRALRDVQIETVLLNEDMAYKHAMMISPAMFREFMLPRYKRIVTALKERGVPLVSVDSDGHISDLLPLWIEAGFDATFPVEIAALNDPIAYREQYGKSIAFFGAIDKREIRSYEQTYAEIMGKVPWLLEQGGYIPSIDHAIPPDMPVRSYFYMVELIHAIAESRPVPGPAKGPEIAEAYMARAAEISACLQNY